MAMINRKYYRNSLLILFILSGFQILIGQVNFNSSNLPIILINTNGRIILNESKIEADMGIIYNVNNQRNQITDQYNNYNGKIGIEYRGSSSLMFPKKSFSFETRTSNGDNLDVSLMDMPEDNDWVLYAPYNDKSLLRNVLTYQLSNKLGRYASRTKYCELVLNGEYQGIYVLMEKIKRGKNRVNISKCEEKDTTGNDLTGGYIIKIDKESGENNAGWYSEFIPHSGARYKILYQYHYPKPDDIQPSQQKYIQTFIRNFEQLMYGDQYNDPVNGYTKVLDVNSFVDYYLINEFSKNVDEFRLSFFMYKDKDSKNPKLIFGPPWDYDISYGNANYYNESRISSWMLNDLRTNSTFLYQDSYFVPFWCYKIIDDSAFVKKVSERWKLLRQGSLKTENIISIIDSLTNLLNEAKDRNFSKWPVLNTYLWPNYYVGKTYTDEIVYLKEWIRARNYWMDAMLDIPVSIKTVSSFYADKIQLKQNYPNPFNPDTHIEYFIPENSHVSLKIFNSLGQEVETIVNSFQISGKYKINWTPGIIPAGVYYYQLKSDRYNEIKKMIFLK
jgi:hypothetical protein